MTDTTKRVDRFELCSYGHNYYMEESDAGDYVRHSDYAALQQQVAELESVRENYVHALTSYSQRAEAAERARDEMQGRLSGLAERWERIAADHGVRQFTGNDHLLFANELRAAFLDANGDPHD